MRNAINPSGVGHAFVAAGNLMVSRFLGMLLDLVVF